MATNQYSPGEAIRAKMKDADCSTRHVSIESGIPYETLRRKLNGHSEFTIKEVANVARAIKQPLGGLVAEIIDRRAA